MGVLLVLGTMTIIIAGLSALSEIDIKKIVALSTLRQLGLMISAIGCNNWSIRYFHLLTHAYIKALLFIRVGNLIHSRLDYQDLRKVSLSMTALPLRASFLACTNLRLCGFPFFSFWACCGNYSIVFSSINFLSFNSKVREANNC